MYTKNIDDYIVTITLNINFTARTIQWTKLETWI